MIKLFSSVAIHQSVFGVTRNFSTCGGPLLFRLSAPLFAEPLKKKKRLDPQILKAREDRKRKKIEKSIRKLEKVNSILSTIISSIMYKSINHDIMIILSWYPISVNYVN